MTGPRVLVVEDNPVTRKMTRVALETSGFRVLEAGDARSALEIAARDPPDLVLQDLRLLDMDGVELCRKLRGMAAMANVPIVAFTGDVYRRGLGDAGQLGFNGILIKPLAPSGLVAAIRGYLAP